MSILNVWIEPEVALVGVDTATSLIGNDGTMLEYSKMFPIVHANTVVAGRGNSIFLSTLFVMCNGRGDFDSLVEEMPLLLQLAFDQIKDLPLLAPPEGIDRQMIVLVGWSSKLGRVAGRDFIQEDRARGFVAGEITPHHLAPWDESFAVLPDPKTAQDMLTLYRAQVSFMRENAPQAAAGGRLIVARIARQGMTIAPACAAVQIKERSSGGASCVEVEGMGV